MINTIIDIYHENSIDLRRARDEGGIVAVIHKSTQGTNFQDPKYHSRREEAKNLGLLWGAFHFSTGESVPAQVENFLSFTEPNEDELISLDWEESDGADMSLQQAREFVQLVKQKTGRWPVLYGGNLLRGMVGQKPDAILANCPLWYVRYFKTPKEIPKQIWPTYALWQYTDGKAGPSPRNTPGAGKGTDRNIFQGTTDQLKAEWPFSQRV